ncbi:hypothetical protein ZOD2009_06479 [Haladaptatus paucihalophilus DX253]|uniref:Uncharacterized protein n=1 Tax=Haladaptatus paucihalophilus DX253 TaxID=797209 RepID=E7QR73_HALPU|nr:hypothetical protein [Haladaptatus paucihalophilus]EFW92981.1 hypothetical protein ZOD2009_06479 [Haladaptatus paucihalophilus DX253]SHL17622.1 hypothetical protein SAMN05444342_3140 [Haladaptatus paucihalophilus DX253]
MSINSLRADGWQDAAGFLLMAIVAVYFWYMNDIYLNWLVLVAGIGAGVLIYKLYKIPEDYPVAAFPITIVVIVAIITMMMIKSLVIGVVAALTVATTIKVYEVYLS